MYKLIATALATLVAAAPGATAGPLKKDRVAADAQWVIHVDVEGFLDSTIGRFILDNAEKFDLDLDELDEFKAHTGLDPRTDLKSVTVYGTGDEPGEDGVIVAVTNDRVDEALEAMLDKDEFPIRKRELDGRTIYVIGDGDDRHYLAVEQADRDRRIVVLSDDRDILANALKVIGQDAPSLSMGKSKIPGDDPQKGSLLFVSVGDIEAFGHADPASQIIRISDGFTADVGEVDGVLVARASVSAESPKVAADIAQVIQGMVALGRLMAAQDPEMGPIGQLADALSIRTDDSRITLKISYDARELMEKVAAMVGGHDDDDDDDQDKDEWNDDESNGDEDDDDAPRRKRQRKSKRSRDP